MARTTCGFNSTASTSGAELLVLAGPTLLVDVGFDKDWRSESKTPPMTGIQQVQALVDTGASESCIDALVATQIGLPIVDRRPISGVGGKHLVNMYLAQIYVPTLLYTIWGAFAGVDLAAGGQMHRALIGRTFLRHFTMIYEGLSGTVTIHNE
jgi:hypothetical protein